MHFSIEKNKNEEYRVTINIPKIIIQKNIIKKFNEINQNKNINGFRKGKIPINIIQEKYGNSVYHDVLHHLMKQYFFDFIQQKKINIIGSPRYYINQEKINHTKNFQYSVIYILKPIFQIKDIRLIKVKKIIPNINKEDIFKEIKKNKKIKIWKLKNKPIKLNDRISIDYKVYINNKVIPELNKNDFSFIVSKNIYLSELYYHVINRYIDDVFFFKIHFSKFHPEKKLQNKNVIFKIKIKKIEEKKTQNVITSDNHMNQINILDYEKTKNIIIQKIKKINKTYIYNQMIKQLIENNPIVIPHILIQEEIQKIYYNNLEIYKNNQGNIFEKKYHIDINLEAKKNVHINLIIQNIISEKKILPNLNAIDELIKKISLNYKKPKKIINLYHNDKKLAEKIKNIELEIQVINFLLKKIQIIKEYYSLEKAIHYAKKIINNDLFYK